jgi:hypothetical protein
MSVIGGGALLMMSGVRASITHHEADDSHTGSDLNNPSDHLPSSVRFVTLGVNPTTFPKVDHCRRRETRAMAMALWPGLPSEPGRSMMSPRVSYRYAWQQVISGLERRHSSTAYFIKTRTK